MKIGQITDLHARYHLPGTCYQTRRRSRIMFDLLPHAINSLKEKNADFLIITGDLLDVPISMLYPNDYYPYPSASWEHLLLGDYRYIKSILDNSGLPYWVIPGNHDKESAFWKVFDAQPHYMDFLGYRLVRFYDREWDFHIPRRFDRERKLWDQMLLENDSPPQIHIQHYVITPELNEGYPHTYFEGNFLKQKNMEASQVLLSISGHYHKGSPLYCEQQTYFTTAPAFGEFPHPFRLYTITDKQVEMETFPLLEKPFETGRKIIFLDRDGVLSPQPRYFTGPDDMSLIPGAGPAVLSLRQAGYVVIIISSQSSIGRGYVHWQTVQSVNETLSALLVEEAGSIEAQPDAYYFSIGAGDRAVHPSLADKSNEKPSPALLHKAVEEMGLDTKDAWMVGDRLSDVKAAEAFGATPVLVRTGIGTEFENCVDCHIAEHLTEAVSYILVSAKFSTVS